ncbi:hypothetical protein BDP27DRAFT_1530114, partial [Rhodocollybia butyracea]
KFAHAVLHIESMIGALPVHEATTLYMGCVDPHLTYGCEVTIDTCNSSSDVIYDVQKSFYRRLLGLSKTSIIAAIFAETGIMPLKHRRFLLQVRFLDYLLTRPLDCLARTALNDSINLHLCNKPSWFSDLIEVKSNLCPHLTFPNANHLLTATSAESLGDYSKSIFSAASQWVQNELFRVEKRSYLLCLRKEPQENGLVKYHTMCRRQYLADVYNAQHRKALTRILAGDHSLAVVRLTWADNHHVPVPHNERLCRFCKCKVETPEHAMLECLHPPIINMHASFLAKFYTIQPNAIPLCNTMDLHHYLAYIASCRLTFPILAKWAFELTKFFNATPMLIPSQYRR